jgi:small subunit ribosomal protein S7
MPRKVTKSLQRKLNPDRKYQSVIVQRLINKSMLDGKKAIAEANVYAALELAAKNLQPNFEVKSRRVGGANYQIPFPIEGHRKQHYAFIWLVQAARSRKGVPYAQRLAAEIVDAHNEAGAAFKKKEDTHRMAEANRAFAHFART